MMSRRRGMALALAAFLCLSGCGQKEPQEEKTPVDVDLTELNVNMAYALATQVIQEPEKYDGQMFRVCGSCNSYEDFETEETYYLCNVPDAAGCCNAGFAFVLDPSLYSDPEDYPGEFDQITLCGKLNANVGEGDYVFILEDAVLEEVVES